MTARAPNIVFILTDQLRHDFLGCYGADFLETPAIDRLAAVGIDAGPWIEMIEEFEVEAE